MIGLSVTSRYTPQPEKWKFKTISIQITHIKYHFQTRFERAVRLFGEDPNNTQPDEFFGVFDSFLSSFAEARHDNENMKRRHEEEEKRAKQEAELKKLTLERKHSREGILSKISKTMSIKSNGDSNQKGEFDDLISALRTGDVFGEDIAKFKRSRKSRIGPGGSPPRRNSATREDSRDRVIANGRCQ